MFANLGLEGCSVEETSLAHANVRLARVKYMEEVYNHVVEGSRTYYCKNDEDFHRIVKDRYEDFSLDVCPPNSRGVGVRNVQICK